MELYDYQNLAPAYRLAAKQENVYMEKMKWLFEKFYAFGKGYQLYNA